MMMQSGLSAAVLAGGLGTRLFPITETMPKPLVPIAGKSALARIFDALRDCGITRVAVTTMYRPCLLYTSRFFFSPARNAGRRVSFFGQRQR